MRQGSGSRRSRGRSNNGKRSFGQGPNRSFESNGPGVKLRGTAAQVFERYLALARDASASGDRVASENLYQHAEHYYRLHSAGNAERKLKTESERAEEEDREDEEGAAAEAREVAVPAVEAAEVVEAPPTETSEPEAAEASEEAPKPAPKSRRRRRAIPKDTEAETSA
jgi:hypothetical protein